MKVFIYSTLLVFISGPIWSVFSNSTQHLMMSLFLDEVLFFGNCADRQMIVTLDKQKNGNVYEMDPKKFSDFYIDMTGVAVDNLFEKWPQLYSNAVFQDWAYQNHKSVTITLGKKCKLLIFLAVGSAGDKTQTFETAQLDMETGNESLVKYTFLHPFHSDFHLFPSDEPSVVLNWGDQGNLQKFLLSETEQAFQMVYEWQLCLVSCNAKDNCNKIKYIKMSEKADRACPEQGSFPLIRHGFKKGTKITLICYDLTKVYIFDYAESDGSVVQLTVVNFDNYVIKTITTSSLDSRNYVLYLVLLTALMTFLSLVIDFRRFSQAICSYIRHAVTRHNIPPEQRF